jgi:isoquinoline 1-oxidoreductase beta subunit
MAALEYANAFYAVIVEVTLDGKGWFNVDRVVVAGDPSFLVNPDMAEAQVEGSVAFGLTSAMYGEITIDKGSVVQGNFNDYRMLRINEMPLVETHWILSGSPHWGGVGEPVAAVVIPALINAIYDAGGPRIRSLPLKNHKMIPRET